MPRTTPPRLNIRLLGPPIIEVDGAPLRVDTRKAIAILAYLTATGRPIAREAVAALLWPNAGDFAARGALRRTVSSLRAGLHDRWLRSDRTSVALERDGVWADVWRVSELLDARAGHAHQATAACAECVAPLAEAAELMRGPFMAGFSLRDAPELDDWIMAEADAWRDRSASVLDALAVAQAEEGRTDAAIHTARRRLALDPLDETAHRRLMRLLARAGDSAGALRQYRECVRILDEELGVAPLPETSAVQREIAEARHVTDVSEPIPAAPPRISVPSADPRRLPLVGRDSELETLLAAWASVADGGRAVILEGEPGIGKSRLAAELAERVAAAGGRVVTVRCYASERHAPFAALSELVRGLMAHDAAIARRAPGWAVGEAARLFPDLGGGTPLPGDRSTAADSVGRRRFLDGLMAVLASALGGPEATLLILDDAQWADDETREVLDRLIGRLDELRCLLVACRRRGERASLVGATRLSLGRLDVESVERLAVASGAGTERVHRLFAETEGVPLFVVEYLAQAVAGGDRHDGPEHRHDAPVTDPERLDELPASVRAMLEARLAALTEQTRQVMTAAAVIGRSFDPEVLRLVSGRSAEETVAALDELLHHGLIRERVQDATYDFDHERTRQLAYLQAGLARRRILHRRVARTLARTRRGRLATELAGTIAQHHRASGDDEAAAVQWERAGAEAERLFAHAEAVEHYGAALALAPSAAAGLHERIGDAETVLGRYAAAEASYEAAAATLPAGDHEDLARVEHKLGALHLRRGDYRLAEAHLTAAIDILPAAETTIRARAVSDRALVLHRLGRGADAARQAAVALRLSTAGADREARAQAHNLLGMLARADGDLDAAAEHLRESLALAAGTPRAAARIAALNNLALVARGAGEPDEAVRLTRRALRLCVAQGDRHREAALRNNLADLLNVLGRRDEARQEVARSVAIFAEVGDPPSAGLQPEIWKLVEW